jgi:hypothetical protein
MQAEKEHALMQIVVCGICGNPDIDIEVWMNVNTSEVGDDSGSSTYYCHQCGEHDFERHEGHVYNHHMTTICAHKPGAVERARQWSTAFYKVYVAP